MSNKRIEIQSKGRPDNFQSPEYCIDYLIPYLKKDWLILEPACGKGNLVRGLKKRGFNVVYSDIEQTMPDSIIADFLTSDFNYVDCIITNPPYSCYSEDTEVYTREGWKLFKEINKTDMILSLNHHNYEIEWVNITKKMSYKFDGNLLNFKNKKMDFLVTPNHRMLAYSRKVSSRLLKGDNIIPAEKVMKSYFIERRGFKWSGGVKKYFILPSITLDFGHFKKGLEERKMPLDKWLAFFGVWIADGYCRHSLNTSGNNRKTIGIKQNINNCNYIENLFKDLGFKYSVYREKGTNKFNFEIHNAQLWEYLKQFGKSREKFIPSWIKDLKIEKIKIFLDNYLIGDSHITRYRNKSSIIISTVSKKLSEDLQELLIKTGTLINFREETVKNGKFYVGSLNKYNLQRDIVIYDSPINVPYNGYVYCLELDKNGILLVRRNNKVNWCGNCKEKFLERCYELGKPFALLMPLTALESKKRQTLFRKHGIQLIIPDKRINFETPSGKGSGAWFLTAWFCYGLNLPKDINFVTLSTNLHTGEKS